MADAYDLIVLGSGPAGYVAAIRASQLGLKVAMVERELLGGICLNWGCIPTKALLRSAEIYHYLTHADVYGLAAENTSFDLAMVVQRSRTIAGKLNAGVRRLMSKNKITVVEGAGTLVGAGKLSVAENGGATELSARDIVIATGARARELPFAKADGTRIWTYRHAMTPKEMPARLLVIGSGAIGIEFASFYSDLGADVTVVEMLDSILPAEDAEISAFMEKQLSKQGVSVLTRASVEMLVATATGVEASIKSKGAEATRGEWSHAIIAIGIVPNTEGIGLEALGVKTDHGRIVIDPHGRTNVDGVWAIGDVTGAPWLAHKAMHEGVIVAEAIAGRAPHPLDSTRIPSCTYSRPQVASVGLTEARARELGYHVNVGKFPFMGNGKAIALGETEGFVKTVFDADTSELLGAHMAGAEVTELIGGYTMARQFEATEADLVETTFPHPTLSEMLHESVLAAYGRALHV